jgi:hypothetical protein
MKANLEFLRKHFGRPFPPPPAEEFQSATRYRRIYRSILPGRWLISPTRWLFHILGDYGNPILPEETKSLVDSRHLLEVKEEIDRDLSQLTARAKLGDNEALQLLLHTARQVTHALEWLETTVPGAVQLIAQQSPNWPVLISPNPQEINGAKERVVRLRVGANALPPKKQRTKVDPGSFWTRVALAFLQTCQANRHFVPLLLEHCKGTKPQRKKLSYWKTEVGVDFHYIDGSHCIAIKDWERECIKLPEPIDNEMKIKEWWKVIKVAVLEYWHTDKAAYAHALKTIGHGKSTPDKGAKEEWERRKMALDRIEQASRDLFSLRVA